MRYFGSDIGWSRFVICIDLFRVWLKISLPPYLSRNRPYILFFDRATLLDTNSPCHLKQHRMHNWAPFYLVDSKVYVDMNTYFYFSFVFAICSSKIETRHVTSDLFMEKVLSCSDSFNSCDLFHTEEKTPKNRLTETLEPQKQKTGAQNLSVAIKPIFSLLYSPTGCSQLALEAETK